MDNKPRRTIKRKSSTGGHLKEDLADMGGRIFTEVLIPKGKDILSNTLDYLLYGEVRGRNSTNKPLNVIDFTDYTKSYNQARPQTPVRNNYLAGSRDWQFEEVMFASEQEAIDTFYELKDVLAREGRLNVNRYYDICRAKVEVPHTMENYGWVDIGQQPRIFKKLFGNEWMYIIHLPNIRYIGGR